MITWNQSHGVSHYEVDVLPDEGTVDVQPSSGETWVAHITDLTVAGGVYDIIVTAYNGEHPGLSQTTQQITGENCNRTVIRDIERTLYQLKLSLLIKQCGKCYTLHFDLIRCRSCNSCKFIIINTFTSI